MARCFVRRRWFSGTYDKEMTSPSGPPADSGRANASRPISIKNARKLSHAREGSVTTSDSASLREKEIANSQDHLDRWSTRAAGGTERAEREWGLSDEVNMGLS